MKLLLILLTAVVVTAQAEVTEIRQADGDPLTIHYPSTGSNGRLIVISHGSGGSADEYADLSRMLVEAGFTVALPEHRGDNYHDGGDAGPKAWERRPHEVSDAIDLVARDPRFSSTLQLDKVGMYGMSAGGHTALTLAGGRWSPALLRKHCDEHIAEDFQGCVGLALRLTGGAFDGPKKWLALRVIHWKLDDETWHSHTDPRIAAVIAGVPFAADFDASSLAEPRVPLGFITAAKDAWLVPRFHSDKILAACKSCEIVDRLESGGHGSLLAPLPKIKPGLLADLLNDPPGFDRATVVPDMNRKIVEFFRRHLH
jgi:predicted dienelactone hydrolase